MPTRPLDVLDIRLTAVSRLDANGSAEVRSLKVRAGEIVSLHVRSSKVDAPQICVAQVMHRIQPEDLDKVGNCRPTPVERAIKSLGKREDIVVRHRSATHR